MQIIDVLPANTTETVCRKEKTDWILKLSTAFAYHLNDKIGV